MILQTLSELYERLESTSEDPFPSYGYGMQGISFAAILDADGTLFGIEDRRTAEGNKYFSRTMIVPEGHVGRTSGVKPHFLWDKSEYLFGTDSTGKTSKRSLKCFEAFRDRHLTLQDELNHDGFQAVCKFLTSWDPHNAAKISSSDEDVLSGFGVFQLRGVKGYIHEDKTIAAFWEKLCQQELESSNRVSQCLISGTLSTASDLHEPLVKGVRGAQTSGAAVVSFNASAFTSYGLDGNNNAPVSKVESFKYATALNFLMRGKSDRRIQVGDATTIYWTGEPSPAEGWFGMILESSTPEDPKVATELHSILKKISEGKFPGELGTPETPFYILGLSAESKSRITIRFWCPNTLGDTVRNLHRHFNDLALVRADFDPEFPSAWHILRETARESKGIPPLLSGALMRAILMGLDYPSMLYQAVLRRIKVGGEKLPNGSPKDRMNYMRAAILKAYLNRNFQKDLPMSLDPDRPEPAYQMGRLFAALEKSQEDAYRDERGKVSINATIKDRYFGAASATPASVFPRLIRLNQHHINKLETPAYKIVHEKRIQEICSHLDQFPSHLNLQEQGLFAIGYYHQRQAFFQKSQASDTPEKD